MFEFGRDLRKLFSRDDAVEDLGWLELISPELLSREARNQSTDAGRVSCARPWSAWMRAAALWREHGRRTGRADSVRRALDAATDAGRAGRTPDERALAAVATVEGLMLKFDLYGGGTTLDQAVAASPEPLASLRGATRARIVAVQARVRLRQVRLGQNMSGGDAESRLLLRAAALMDAAIAAFEAERAGPSDDLRLERAALALEAGVMRRDAELLDQSGRELRRLVADADPDQRPLARARALTLCAAGLSALASLAGDPAAHAQARVLFDGAADAFTSDHSPLDWVAIQLARSATPSAVSLATLRQVESLSAGQGLVLGALARDRHMQVETRAAETARDRDRLETLTQTVMRRLAVTTRRPDPMVPGGDRSSEPAGDLDWAVDQIALARLAGALSRLSGRPASPTAALALFEAAEIARERGVPDLAERAEALMPARSINV